MAIATLEVFRMRYRAFCDRFGRDPEPDEPLFFDPAQDRPVPPEPAVIRAQVMLAASAAGVDGRTVLNFMRLESVPASRRHRGIPERACLSGLPEEPSSK